MWRRALKGRYTAERESGELQSENLFYSFTGTWWKGWGYLLHTNTIWSQSVVCRVIYIRKAEEEEEENAGEGKTGGVDLQFIFECARTGSWRKTIFKNLNAVIYADKVRMNLAWTTMWDKVSFVSKSLNYSSILCTSQCKIKECKT